MFLANNHARVLQNNKKSVAKNALSIYEYELD